jgi:hypothetical protein
MESLISSYGIDFKDFQNTITSLNGLVAGSSALAEYLKQEKIDPGFQPKDLDIFIPGYMEPYTDYILNNTKYMIRSLNIMRYFLTKYGFIENTKFKNTFETGYESLKTIQKIVSFNNNDGKEIQLIIVDCNDTTQYILNDFDLSVCISWWDSHTNCFKTINPDTTKRKEMYILEVEPDSERSNSRLQKYISRGFKLIDKPCPFIVKPDTRNLLSDTKFDSINVIDIFTLEETTIREHLQNSEMNIVIKAGETYYGFKRNTLINYMSNKFIYIDNIGTLFQTPFNQCITSSAYNDLQYSDYSIYELKSAYSVPYCNEQVKSLFNLHCYTVKQWIDGSEGVTNIVPPPITNEYNHLEDIPFDVDDVIEAHAYLIQAGNLEAFLTSVLENHNEV